MMCHEVTGNLAEKISFLEYEARLVMMCFSTEVQLSPPPDPIPHRALSSPLPILCLPAGQEARWAVLSGEVTHVCWLPGTGPRAGISADSALSLSLSRDMNWSLCPTQSKAGLLILEKLNFYPRNSISRSPESPVWCNSKVNRKAQTVKTYDRQYDDINLVFLGCQAEKMNTKLLRITESLQIATWWTMLALLSLCR